MKKQAAPAEALPPACERCAPHGFWISDGENSSCRCNCARGRALTASDEADRAARRKRIQERHGRRSSSPKPDADKRAAGDKS